MRSEGVDNLHVQFFNHLFDHHYPQNIARPLDYDPVLIAYNDEDYYGDGNNIMVATKKAAADIWLSIDALKEKRRKVAEARERARRIEKRKPKYVLLSISFTCKHTALLLVCCPSQKEILLVTPLLSPRLGV